MYLRYTRRERCGVACGWRLRWLVEAARQAEILPVPGIGTNFRRGKRELAVFTSHTCPGRISRIALDATNPEVPRALPHVSGRSCRSMRPRAWNFSSLHLQDLLLLQYSALAAESSFAHMDMLDATQRLPHIIHARLVPHMFAGVVAACQHCPVGDLAACL